MRLYPQVINHSLVHITEVQLSHELTTYIVNVSMQCCSVHVFRFIEKYHPKRVSALNEAAATNLQSRVKAFLFLLESGRLDKVPLSCDKQEEIVTIMDAGRLH